MDPGCGFHGATGSKRPMMFCVQVCVRLADEAPASGLTGRRAGLRDVAAWRARLVAAGELCGATWQRSTGFSSRLPLGLC